MPDELEDPSTSDALHQNPINITSRYTDRHKYVFSNFQSILPTPERVYAFQYLYGHTIQMTVYGHPITYGTIGTVVAGILAAFASKILLQEISIL